MASTTLGRVLIVDDEIELTNALIEALTFQGYAATGFLKGEDALEALKAHEFDLLLTDLMMPGMDGITLLKAGLEIDPNLVGIIMTGQGTVPTAVEAMKTGAFDYVLKPFRIEAILPVLARAREVRRLRLENVQLRETVAIYNLSQTIAFSLDSRLVLENTADAAIQQTGADEVSIMLLTPDRKQLSVVAVRGKSREHLLGMRIPLHEGIAGWVARQSQPLILNGVVNDRRFAPLRPRAEIFSAISMPMLAAGKLMGVLNVNNLQARRPFTPGQVKALSILTSTAAAALENEALYDALKASEKRFRSWVENSSDLVTVIDRGGKIVYESPSIERLLGYTQDELLGKDAFELVHPEDRSRIRALFTEGIQNLSADACVEYRIRHRDGSWRHFESLGRTQSDEHGEVTGLVNSRDITSRKVAEEMERRRTEELEALAYVSSRLRQAYNGAETQNLILEATLRAMGAQAGTLLMLDTDKQELFVAAAAGYPSDVSQLRLKMGQGLAGQCAQSEMPVLSADVAVDPRIAMPEPFENLHKAICAPLKSTETLLGVLLVCFAEAGQPTINEVNLLTTLADNLGSALHRAILFEETQERAAQLALLYDAGLALNSVLEPLSQLEYLIKIAMDVTKAERAAFYRCNNTSDELQLEFGLGFDESTLAELYKLRFWAADEQNPVGWVSEHRRPMNAPEISPSYRSSVIDPDVRSGIWVPVVRAGKLIGVISVFSTRSKAFTPDDERLLILFGNQASVAMENARLFAETNRRIEHLKALRAIDLTITSSFDLGVIFNVLLDKVTTQLNLDAACVLLLDPVTHTLEYTSGKGFRTRALQQTRLPLGEGYAGLAALERRIIHVPSLQSRESNFLRSPLFLSENFVTYYAVPLIAKGHVMGVMEVFQRAPLDPDQEWIDFLEALAGQAAIALDNARLFDDLQRSNFELRLAYDTTIEGWSQALDLRDKETEGHSQRVTDMTLKLARKLGMNDSELINVRRGALLHDIGKMGIPDTILTKPGALSDEEWETMRKHPVYAYDLLAPIEYLRPALNIPYCHHEKWDGTGYPRGLKGEEIPLEARIFAIVDVWDALSSDRPYRQAWAKESVIQYIQDQSGKHFDPRIVVVFMDEIKDAPGEK